MAKKPSSDRGTPLLQRLITTPCEDKPLWLYISAELSKKKETSIKTLVLKSWGKLF